jgi:hypothetical protein
VKTKEFVIPTMGVVVVHHVEDWSGDVTIEWDDQHGHHARTLPAIAIDLIGQAINKSKKTRSHHARPRR